MRPKTRNRHYSSRRGRTETFPEVQGKTAFEFVTSHPCALVYFGSHVGDNCKERSLSWFLNSLHWGVCNNNLPKPFQSVARSAFNGFCILLVQAPRTLPRSTLSDLEESVITHYQTELGTTKVVKRQSCTRLRDKKMTVSMLEPFTWLCYLTRVWCGGKDTT